MKTYETLAYLKICKKLIEKEINNLEKNLRANERITPLGKFRKIIKTTPVFDTQKIITTIGEHNYIKASKPTKKNLIEVIGNDCYEALVAKEIITLKENKPSLNFYQDKTAVLPEFTLSAIHNQSEPFIFTINQ